MQAKNEIISELIIKKFEDRIVTFILNQGIGGGNLYTFKAVSKKLFYEQQTIF